jgi:hypothetical protein
MTSVVANETTQMKLFRRARVPLVRLASVLEVATVTL